MDYAWNYISELIIKSIFLSYVFLWAPAIALIYAVILIVKDFLGRKSDFQKVSIMNGPISAILGLASGMVFWYMWVDASRAGLGGGVVYILLAPSVVALGALAIAFGVISIKREVNFSKAFGIIGVLFAIIPILLFLIEVFG